MKATSCPQGKRRLAALMMAVSALVASAGEPSLRPCWRNIDGDARAKLAEWERAGKGWRRQTEATKLFVRGQFFYGLNDTFYIHNYYERPLLQDSSLNAGNERGHMLNAEAWKRTVRVGREMGLDGFAFFPTNPGCWDLLPRSVLPGGEFPLLAELHNGDRVRGVKHCADVAGKILAMPNAFRIGGRTLLTCYPTATWPDKAALDFWPELRKELDARYGADRFALVPYMCLFDLDDLDRGRMTVGILERTREHLREILRKTDGIFYLIRESAWASPEILRRPHREVVVPLVTSVLAEPEFRGKLYGIGFWQAHADVYVRFGDLPSFGAMRLVSALDEIVRVQPDFAIGFEWDEQNENTHFRPTVSRGFTTQRIMRHYSDVLNARPLSPYPGDGGRADVPNLIVSYRKSVQAGEPVEAQVLNVPDGTQPKGGWTVGFRWTDAEGRTVRAFAPQRLASGACTAVSFAASSVDLLAHQVLYPEVTVGADGFAKRTFSDGFWPIGLEANRNPDCVWVRHALREIPSGVSGRISLGSPRADGSRVVTGEVRGPKAFRSVEVLENQDTVYLHDAAHPEGRTDDGHVRIRIGLDALMNFWKDHSATGTISVLNAPNAVLSESNPPYTFRKANVWTLNQPTRRYNFLNTHFVDLPAAEAQSASVLIDLPDSFPRLEVAVADLLKRDVIGFAGPAGSQIVVAREITQETTPPPCNVKEAKFSFVVKPRNPLSVFRLQAIDEDGRVWRGKARSVFRPTGRSVTFPVYDLLSEGAREATVDAGRTVSLSYRFDGGNGDIHFADGWRDLPLVGGGGVGLVTRLGCGRAKAYGHALAQDGLPVSAPGNGSTRPRPFVESDGTVSLAFEKCAFASLPLQTIPCFAGFELRLRLMPLGMEGREGLVDSGPLGFRLWMDDGVPSAYFSLGNEILRLGINDPQGATACGPKLRKGEWNELVVRMDQRELWIGVNGVSGRHVPCRGWQFNGWATALGTHLGDLRFFRGRIAAVDVRPLER